jgi:hypothetical protein
MARRVHNDVGVGQDLRNTFTSRQVEPCSPAGRYHVGTSRHHLDDQLSTQTALTPGHHHSHPQSLSGTKGLKLTEVVDSRVS